MSRKQFRKPFVSMIPDREIESMAKTGKSTYLQKRDPQKLLRCSVCKRQSKKRGACRHCHKGHFS